MIPPTRPGSLDTTLQLLVNQQRRAVLRELRDNETDTVDFSELVAQVADSTPLPGDRGADQLAIQLHHTHLPKLADANLVSYDTEENVVEYHPDDRVEELLRAIETVSQHA